MVLFESLWSPVKLNAPVAIDDESPIAVKSSGEPGRQPYVASIGFSQFGCFTIQCTNLVKSGSAVLFDGPEIPAGKRLVIQYIKHAWT